MGLIISMGNGSNMTITSKECSTQLCANCACALLLPVQLPLNGKLDTS